MNYQIVKQKDINLIKEAVRIHYRELGSISLLASFGQDFLLGLYKYILKKKGGFLIVAFYNRKPQGLSLGIFDNFRIEKFILAKFYYFLPLLVLKIIKDPTLTNKIIQAIIYYFYTRGKTKFEILALSVSHNYRSRGIGSKLLTLTGQEFIKFGASEYKVCVRQKMTRACHFYRKNGLKVNNSFNLFGESWYGFVKKLS